MSNSSPPENSVQEFIRSLRESSTYKDITEETLETTNDVTIDYLGNSSCIASTCYNPMHSISSITSANTITFTGGTGVTSNYAYVNSPSIYTISNSTNTCIPNINTINLTGMFSGEDWINQFPDFDKIQKMCEEYPGLKIAFEKFKTT